MRRADDERLRAVIEDTGECILARTGLDLHSSVLTCMPTRPSLAKKSRSPLRQEQDDVHIAFAGQNLQRAVQRLIREDLNAAVGGHSSIGPVHSSMAMSSRRVHRHAVEHRDLHGAKRMAWSSSPWATTLTTTTGPRSSRSISVVHVMFSIASAASSTRLMACSPS